MEPAWTAGTNGPRAFLEPENTLNKGMNDTMAVLLKGHIFVAGDGAPAASGSSRERSKSRRAGRVGGTLGETEGRGGGLAAAGPVCGTCGLSDLVGKKCPKKSTWNKIRKIIRQGRGEFLENSSVANFALFLFCQPGSLITVKWHHQLVWSGFGQPTGGVVASKSSSHKFVKPQDALHTA